MATCLPTAREDVQARDLGDEFVLYDDNVDRLHVLNRSAREIWLLCDGTRSHEDIAAELCERFDVDLETARGDVAQTVDELTTLGLVNR